MKRNQARLTGVAIAAAIMVARGASAAEAPAAAPAVAKAQVVELGGALDGPVVSIYAPPTRSSQPFAATRLAVYSYDDEARRWNRVYRAPAGDAGIELICGYAKSSKVLYVAHGGAVARTGDAGRSWTESQPPGLLPGDKFIALSVNPEDRKDTLLATAQRLWSTEDYGATWKPLPRPSEAEPLTALHFAGGAEPAIAAATTHSVFQCKGPGKPWVAVMRSIQGPRLLSASPGQPLVAAFDGGNNIYAFDLSRPGWHIQRPLAARQDVKAIAVDFAGRGAVWLAEGTTLALCSLREDGPESAAVAEFASPLLALSAHPRQNDAVYVAYADRLARVDAAFGPAAATLADALPESLFKQAEVQDAQAAAPGGDAGAMAKAEALLSETLASQPPIEEVIGEALKFSRYQPERTDAWKANVRRRNLLPALKVGSGRNEANYDRYRLHTDVDRYGVPSVNDLNQTDGTRDLDTFRIELSWDLSRLAFDEDAIKISQEGRRLAQVRNELIEQVTRLYYQRIELLVDMRMNEASMGPEARVRSRLKMAELSTLLDGLSGRPLFTQPAAASVLPANEALTPPARTP